MDNNDEYLKKLNNMIKMSVEDVMALNNLLTGVKQGTNKVDNVVRINGNNFTDYDKAIQYINNLKNKDSSYTWYEYNVQKFGIGYAILKWCQSNDKYYNERMLNLAISEYSDNISKNEGDFAKQVLEIYNKILSLPQYRGKRFEGLTR
jgi:PDZ domain-containing secreted protein